MPTAFNGAIDRIRKAGKATPVLFGHELGNVHAVLGMIPPDGWSVHHDGLRARGWVDTTDPIGAKLFKMLRSNALQWSIGFSLIGGKNATRGPDGVVVLEQVDELFELSVTPLPANSRTRTIGAKAERIPTHAELLEREKRRSGSTVRSPGSSMDAASSPQPSTSCTPTRTPYATTVSSQPSSGCAIAGHPTSTPPWLACASRRARR